MAIQFRACPEDTVQQEVLSDKKADTLAGDRGQRGQRGQRDRASTTFSEAQQQILACVAAGQTLRGASEAIGLDSLQAREWLLDPDFARAFKAAETLGTDVIEEEAFRRAVTGVEKPVYRAGEVVGHVADYSDSMLMFLLKARRPERYDPKSASERQGADAQTIAKQLDLEGARRALVSKFDQVTQRRKT